MTNSKVPQSEREYRLYLLSEICLKLGVYKPSVLLEHPDLHKRYNVYKNPYDAIKQDLKKVENVIRVFGGTADDIEAKKGELLSTFTLIKKELWECLESESLIKNKLEIYRELIELEEKIATYHGILPEANSKTSIKAIEVSNTPLNSNKDLTSGLEKLEKGLSEFSSYFDPVCIKEYQDNK